MKIGVITYWSSKDNYGQLLQCYALQQYLLSLNHEPFLIRYVENPKTDSVKFKWSNLVAYIIKFPRYVRWFLSERKKRYDKIRYQRQTDFEKRNFSKFLRDRIKITDIYTPERLKSNPPYADAYICGSDQIWGGDDDIYFLSFAPDEAIKIAYAPSMGGASYSDATAAWVKRYLYRFDLIGMREQSGVDACVRMGFNDAVKVTDPTLLLSEAEYRSISKTPSTNHPFAFVYLLGNQIGVSIEQIEQYIHSLNLEMIYVASQGRYDGYDKIDPTIEEWLGWIAHADVVITNSFHCTVFSLLFHRNFITIPLAGGYARMNTRIEELLNECGLGHRIMSKEFPKEEMTDEDFNLFEQYIAAQRNVSYHFLSILNR